MYIYDVGMRLMSLYYYVCMQTEWNARRQNFSSNNFNTSVCHVSFDLQNGYTDFYYFGQHIPIIPCTAGVKKKNTQEAKSDHEW